MSCNDRGNWFVTWNCIQQGRGCPECKSRNSNGGYSIKLAERNKYEWLLKQAIVYTIECWNNNEYFYKIGITMKKTKQRFCNKKVMPYSYKIINEIHTNLYDATYLEKQLHEQNKQYKYKPLIKFGGWTECFSDLVNLEELEEQQTII